MIHTLEETNSHRLELEYLPRGETRGWWLILVEKQTGMTRIMIHKNKKMWDGVTIDFAIKMMANLKPVKMYKSA